MRHGRWIAGLTGVAAVALLVAPAGAGVKTAASDKTLLQAGVIGAGDVPATWQAAKQPDGGAKQFQGIASCKQITPAVASAHSGPHKLSPQFGDPSNNGNTLAENTVFVFKNPAGATKFLAAFSTTNAPICYRASLQKQAGSRGQVGALAPLTSLQGVGDQSVGYETPVQLGAQATLVVDIVGVRVGRTILAFTFSNPTQQIASGPQIVNAVVNRLAKAAA